MTFTLRERADTLLRDAVASRSVPGVVAMATDREGTLYEGAFGERMLGSGEAMTRRQRGLDRLNDEGAHDHRGVATRRAGQA